MYPELPSFSMRSGEDEENSEETTSLLHRQSNTFKGALPTTGHKTTSSEDPGLVTDLMRENTRLADEVANLRRILQDQQQVPTIDSIIAHVDSNVETLFNRSTLVAELGVSRSRKRLRVATTVAVGQQQGQLCTLRTAPSLAYRSRKSLNCDLWLLF